MEDTAGLSPALAMNEFGHAPIAKPGNSSCSSVLGTGRQSPPDCMEDRSVRYQN